MLTNLVHWCVAALSLIATAYFLPGFKVGNFPSALIIAAVVGLANILVKPVLFILTLPINILTLGLFTLVLNGMIIKLAAAMLPNFQVDGWGTAIFGALLVSIFSTVFRFLLGL